MLNIKSTAVFLCFFVLVGCGGGGSSSSENDSNINPPDTNPPDIDTPTTSESSSLTVELVEETSLTLIQVVEDGATIDLDGLPSNFNFVITPEGEDIGSLAISMSGCAVVNRTENDPPYTLGAQGIGFTTLFTGDCMLSLTPYELDNEQGTAGEELIINFSIVDSSPPAGSNNPPVITVNGNVTVYVELGENYVDQGASADDVEDGDLSGSIQTTGDIINTQIPGTYIVTYSVVDSDGAEVTAIRSVVVSDDQPSSSSYPVEWESDYNLPLQDANGFSILTPSPTSRLIYVDADGGNDSTAQTYTLSDSEIGDDHQDPSGVINAYATISAAMAQARVNQDDWVMLQRGDTWTDPGVIAPKYGISVDRRSVVTWYGSDTARPKIHSGSDDGGIRYLWTEGSYSAVIGIHFYAYLRDPDNPNFVGWSNTSDENGLGLRLHNFDQAMQGILIEDNVFDFYESNTIQQGSTNALTDIIIRRNVISNNYSTGAHSQGLFLSSNSGTLIEENLFDHNGWYKQQIGTGNDREEGQATIFNHNTYFSGLDNLVMRNNIFMRASSIGNKFTANPSGGTDTLETSNILLHRNVYAEGELAFSIGGNTDNNNGPRFSNVHIIDTVVTDIGATQPTNRTLGWGLEAKDWSGGVIQGNIFKNWGTATIGNTYALAVTQHSSNVDINDNIFYGLSGGNNRQAVNLEGANASNITFTNNDIVSFGANPIQLIEADNLSAFTILGNTYNSTHATPFVVDGSTLDYSAGVVALGDSTATDTLPSYTNTSLDLKTYSQANGGAATLDGLKELFLSQSAKNWLGLTGGAARDYIAAGME